jgi:gamma-glutamyltranspeptidase/glutathione hydrolase
VISKLLIQYSFSAALLFALNVGISSSHAQSGWLTQDRPEAAHAGASATPTAQQPFSHHVVSTANLHASAAGLEILRAGGSAVDAAIAAQLVLTLVEPQSSGIGGGALMLHFNGQSIQAYDGRETAPRSADTDLWLRNREPIAFQEAVIGGRSVGPPGVLRLLELAHRHHGRLAWPALFAPAIRLAENGFEISPRLNALLQRDLGLRSDPRARAFFYSESGHAHPVGTRLRNQELAVLFREIAQQGANVFYRGAIARQIVTLVQHHPTAPGLLDLEDI